MTTPPETLTWVPALEHPPLLATATHEALARWADADPEAARRAMVAEIDPELSDTAALTEAYSLDPELSANCVVVSGRREGEERVAGLVVRATTRADVNGAVKRLLDVRKASFLPMDRATSESGMEHGGITPVGLPEAWGVLADARTVTGSPVLLGSGIRRSKLWMPAEVLATLPGLQVVDDLAR